MLRVRVTTPVRPSEDPTRVERCIRTIVPDGSITVDPDRILGESATLDGFRRLVWRQRILDATRRVLLSSLDEEGKRAAFRLNKQAAYAGHVSFAVAEAPLGEVHVEVEGDHLEALFKEIAPPTLRGKPVSEEEYEQHLERQRKTKSQTKYVAREAPPVNVPAADEEE